MKEVRDFPKVGDIIHIYHMFGESYYKDTEGIVKMVDEKNGYVYGTWGACALVPGDDYVILKEE